ncbi:hypothetical protein BH24ACT5_BH24ACT5_14390 [soil metagenome]
MAAKRIVIDVHGDGTVVATTHGVIGPSCLDEVARIENLAGTTVESSRLTADYGARPVSGEVVDDVTVVRGEE